ncbi:hypothetical protein P8452_56977 [Trifolium repens]|nr:hypothetical protein P8452_56977 [Trifolium repens]
MEYVSYDDPSDEENDCPLDEENDSPNNEEKDAHNEENEITRGITIMKKVIRARDKGIKYEVGWNELGQPIDPNGSMFILQKFRSLRGARVQRSKLNNISWIRIQCPRQCNSIDCGYFVMRFMKEIVISNQNVIPVSYFDDFKCPTYSKDKLTEIKEEWSQISKSTSPSIMIMGRCE